MGKKKGEGSRNKNCPSSSSVAASLVPSGVFGIGFGGYIGSSEIESSSITGESLSFLNVNSDVALHLKRLSRKDPTTKLKALSALSLLFKQKPAEEIVQIVPQWAFEYKKLLLDYNREVRRATHDAMTCFVAVVRRGLAPHLKFLMGPWWFAQFDPSPEVSQAARCSFETLFPAPEKRLDALILCVDEIFVYLDDNLKLNAHAMPDKVTPLDELEDMHHRVLSCSLMALATLIEIVLNKEFKSNAENASSDLRSASRAKITVTSAADKLFSMHNGFLHFMKHKSPSVRSATYSVFTSYIKNIPHAFNEGNMKSLSTAILNSFQDKDMACHSSMWDMIVLFSKKFPEAWHSNKTLKTVLNGLWQFLRSGCYGSQKVSYPALVILLESIPPLAVNSEQFFFLFFQNLWAGGYSLNSAADNAVFLKAFQECFLWVLDNVARFSKSEADKSRLPVKLVNDTLIDLLWNKYLPVNAKNQGEGSQEIITGFEIDSLSNEMAVEKHNYSSSFIQEIGKCIINILTHISVIEFSLLHGFFSTFVKDSLTVLQHRSCSKIFQEYLRRIINFFVIMGQLSLHEGQTWPWEFLAGPLIASSFTIIKTLDSIDAIKLLSVLIGIFDRKTVLSHIHVCNKGSCSINSARNGDHNFIAEHFLQTFKDDFVPWCLLYQPSSSGAKLDLLLSLILDEYLSNQWSAIIAHFTEVDKCCRADTGIIDHANNIKSFVMLFEKLREKVRFMRLENVQRFGALPEHWHHVLLDSTAVYFVCEAPCFCFSHAELLRTLLGGSIEDDQICFLSRAAAVTIFEQIVKMLVLYLNASSLEWTRRSCFSLLSLVTLDLAVIPKSFVFENLEIVQFVFHVLEGSFFSLKLLDGNGALISSILASLFIIEWEYSMSSITDDDNDSVNYHEPKVHVLSHTQIKTDDHLIEKTDAKLSLEKQVHSMNNILLMHCPSILSLCNLSELKNILIQTIRCIVSEASELRADVIFSLCSSWVMVLLKVTCSNFNEFQCLLDELLSETNSWPLWVAPLFQDGSRSATLKCLRSSDGIKERSHGNFVSFVDKLISKLGVAKVIVGCGDQIPIEAASNQLFYSRVWLAAELLCTWSWKGGNALNSLILPLSKHVKDDNSMSGVKIISSMMSILFDGALIHGANNHWIAFCSWITSDGGVDKIENLFLRALVVLLHTFLVNETMRERLVATDFIEYILGKLYFNGHVNMACLRIIPHVLSYAVRPLVFERTEFDGFSKDASLVSFKSSELYDSIITWLDNAANFPPLHLLQTGNKDCVEWIQAILACYPLSSHGGIGKLKLMVSRKISKMEQDLLLSLFRKQRNAAGALAEDKISAMRSPSTSSFIFPTLEDVIIAKLTAITVAYCWEELAEEDWSFVMAELHKWIEPSILLMEEIAERVDDVLSRETIHDMEAILKKLEKIVQRFDPFLVSLCATSLVTFSLFSELLELENADSIEAFQFIKHGIWLQVKDQIMENVLRLFFTTGVVEAIAESFSKEASSIIASNRLDYSLFWSIVASSVIKTPECARSKAVESMELWGLSKGPISSLYAILFSSKPICSLQLAAYIFLSTKPVIHLSILKDDFQKSNGETSQERLFTSMDGFSEQSLCLRDEISCLILKPAEYSEKILTGIDCINYFLSWALLLTHLHSLPSSSTTRERLVQFIHYSIRSTILDCLFQHIPLKELGASLKKKDAELSGDALQAANAAMHATSTGSLLLCMESVFPVGAGHMASLAGSIYGMMIQVLPSYVRNWFNSLRDHSMSSAIELFTKIWCSPYLISNELSQVKEIVVADDSLFSLYVNKSAHEIIATYKKENTGIDLVIRLPSCYPLQPVVVESTRSLGINESKQRNWLLSLTVFVRNQNGAIAEAIRKWKSNFDKEFEGIEECPICYSIIHTADHSLPRKSCSTCKHRFHSACLFKWFSTSHKSTCPLCQTPF